MIDPKYEYWALYSEMPAEELEEALCCRRLAKSLNVKALGRPLTAFEHRERNRLNARHQALVCKYDPIFVKKRNAGQKRRRIKRILERRAALLRKGDINGIL